MREVERVSEATGSAVRLPIIGEAWKGIVSAGQPREDQWRAVREAGFGTVVDLREEWEPRGHDEARAVEAAGLRYERLEVGHGPVADEVFDRMREIVRERGEAPLFIHCVSGNRVGGALIPALMLDEGATEREALEAAVRAGLSSRDLAAMALDYVRRKSEEGA